MFLYFTLNAAKSYNTATGTQKEKKPRIPIQQIKVTLICRQTEVISTSPLLACGTVSFNVQMHQV